MDEYYQGRVVAPDPNTAAKMVIEKLRKKGYKVERLTMFPCPVQYVKGQIWIEWMARVKNKV